MQVAELTPTQWAVGGVAALFTGMSKTGLPGAGILVVPVMAWLFPSKLSVGLLLPMLITADLFAVAYHRRNARWDQLVRLVPAVLAGMAAGLAVLLLTSPAAPASGAGAEAAKQGVDWFRVVIGGLVLAMLAIGLLRRRLGERLAPGSPLGLAATGAAAGFTTTLANAAGPIMNIYLAGMKLPKEQFMGTVAWFFLLVNVAKIPLFVVYGLLRPAAPMITGQTLLYDAAMIPPIVVGAFVGMWLFRKVSQRIFLGAVLILAALAAVNLVVGPFLAE